MPDHREALHVPFGASDQATLNEIARQGEEILALVREMRGDVAVMKEKARSTLELTHQFEVATGSGDADGH
jgi:hypothetical protein